MKNPFANLFKKKKKDDANAPPVPQGGESKKKEGFFSKLLKNRLGKQSIRFELRRGDCGIDEGGYNDCTIWDEKTGHTSERHELGSKDKFPSKGVTWHTYSIFLTKDFHLSFLNYFST